MGLCRSRGLAVGISRLGLKDRCLPYAVGSHPLNPSLDGLFLLALVLPTLALSLIATFRATFCGGGGTMLAEGLGSGLIGLWVGLSWFAIISFSQGNIP